MRILLVSSCVLYMQNFPNKIMYIFPISACVKWTSHHIDFNFLIQIIFNEDYNYSISYRLLTISAVNWCPHCFKTRDVLDLERALFNFLIPLIQDSPLVYQITTVCLFNCQSHTTICFVHGILATNFGSENEPSSGHKRVQNSLLCVIDI
jgi:hypothetical protein